MLCFRIISGANFQKNTNHSWIFIVLSFSKLNSFIEWRYYLNYEHYDSQQLIKYHALLMLYSNTLSNLKQIFHIIKSIHNLSGWLVIMLLGNMQAIKIHFKIWWTICSVISLTNAVTKWLKFTNKLIFDRIFSRE